MWRFLARASLGASPDTYPLARVGCRPSYASTSRSSAGLWGKETFFVSTSHVFLIALDLAVLAQSWSSSCLACREEQRRCSVPLGDTVPYPPSCAVSHSCSRLEQDLSCRGGTRCAGAGLLLGCGAAEFGRVRREPSTLVASSP